MSRIEKLAKAIASYICNPADAIEIGGVSSQLYDIIKIVTKGDKRLKDKVHEWLIFYIEEGNTIIKEYADNMQSALDDYDAHFF